MPGLNDRVGWQEQEWEDCACLLPLGLGGVLPPNSIKMRLSAFKSIIQGLVLLNKLAEIAY